MHTDHRGWLSKLSLAEFAYNNNVHSRTMYSPFVSNYGFDPRTPYNLIEPQLETNKKSNDVLHSWLPLLALVTLLLLRLSVTVKEGFQIRTCDIYVIFNPVEKWL